MADRFSEEQRSYVMSRIKSKDTKPEMILRKSLHELGFRYRLHSSDLPGKPDMIFPKFRICIFVHGCFWHRHEGCPRSTMPKTNTLFWQEKFHRNKNRDIENVIRLFDLGWRVEIVWECELSTHEKRLHVIDKLSRLLVNR